MVDFLLGLTVKVQVQEVSCCREVFYGKSGGYENVQRLKDQKYEGKGCG